MVLPRPTARNDIVGRPDARRRSCFRTCSFPLSPGTVSYGGHGCSSRSTVLVPKWPLLHRDLGRIPVKRVFIAIALVLAVTVSLVAGGYMFRPDQPANQPPSPAPRSVQTVSVTTFRNRWAALGPQAVTPPTSRETASASPGPLPVAEVMPQQIQPAPPPPRRAQAARPVVGELCARHGLHRVEYRRGGHLYWRCAA